MLKIYTDGSCLSKKDHPDKGKGGLGIIVTINDEIVKKISKGYKNTTISRMEGMAVLFALQILDKTQKAEIISDSQYIINSFNKNWLLKWEKENWVDLSKSEGKRLNYDIMQALLKEYRKFPKGNIKFTHVRGHGNVEGNCMADELASYKNFIEFEEDVKLNNF